MSDSNKAEGLANPILVQVLLAEYSAIRSHVIARTAAAIQTVTIGSALLALTLSQLEANPKVGKWLIVVIAVTVAVVGGAIWRDMMLETRQVRALERRINALVGHELLTYETDRSNQRLWLWRVVKTWWAGS